MEEKRSELRSEKQRKLLEKLVNDLSHRDPGFYYQSTSDIAHILRDHIDAPGALSVEEKTLLAGITPRDIQLLLSIR